MINVTEYNLLSTIGFWAIYQSPRNRPRNLDVVIEKIRVVIQESFKTIFKMKYKEFEDRECLYNWLDTTLKGIDEVNQWNLSEIELRNNIDVNSPDRNGFVFTSAFNTIKEEHNFVDIDALIQNVCYMLIKLSQE